jgi:hypothetical protein
MPTRNYRQARRSREESKKKKKEEKLQRKQARAVPPDPATDAVPAEDAPAPEPAVSP